MRTSCEVNVLWSSREAKKEADKTALITSEESGDAVGLICAVRMKHPIDDVEHTLTTELTFNNMNYRKAVATLNQFDQLMVSYHSYCCETSKLFTPVNLLAEVARLTAVFNDESEDVLTKPVSKKPVSKKPVLTKPVSTNAVSTNAVPKKPVPKKATSKKATSKKGVSKKVYDSSDGYPSMDSSEEDSFIEDSSDED